MNYKPHIFAGNNIDRGDTLRRSESGIRGLMRSDQTRVLVFLDFNPLVDVNNSDAASLAWLSTDDAARVSGAAKRLETFLGVNDDGSPLVAWNLESGERDDRGVDISVMDNGSLSFEDAREAAGLISGVETGILAQAKSNLDWHFRHQYCSRCGEMTEMRRGGLMRNCNSCKTEHFPRSDPVVITVVTDGDRCLLGQSSGRLSRMRMYSALAGFMDHGESMEEAVRREVKEEAGIEVGQVRYHSSQPWPFPSSLMIGSHSQALTTNIDKDDFEMTDVRWFTRDEVFLALEQKNPSLNVPGPIAIAHHLIKSWANGDVPTFETSE